MTSEARVHEQQLDEVERTLLEVLLHDHAYDYRGVAVPWLRQKILECVRAERLDTVRGLREKVWADERCRQRLLEALAGGPRGLFADSDFYRAFRESVVPWLRTYPSIRVWHVGCSTSDEVYSMAVLLSEQGLYDRSTLYVTDLDPTALERTRQGEFPAVTMPEHTSNYLLAGGTRPLSDFFVQDGDAAVASWPLKKNIVIAQHSLETDGPFNEFQVILCRSGLDMLSSRIQSRAYRLFDASLVRFGLLCLNPRNLAPSVGVWPAYEPFVSAAGIVRRIH